MNIAQAYFFYIILCMYIKHDIKHVEYSKFFVNFIILLSQDNNDEKFTMNIGI